MRRFIVLLLLAVAPQSMRSQTTNNVAPTVTISMENYAPVMLVGKPVTLQAQAHDPDGTVQWLKVYQSGMPVPGTISGTNGTFTAIIYDGPNNFQAQAIDDSGSIGFSQILEVQGNAAPSIVILEPKLPVTLYSLTNAVTIRADAYDFEGAVTEVRLLENGVLLASDYQAPYEFVFRPAGYGEHRLEVQAVDSFGVTSSAIVVANYVRLFDDFGIGIPISTGTNVTLRGTTVNATRQKGEPNHAGVSGGRSIWWSWRPTVTGTVTIDTFGSDFDTVLGVYTNASPFLASPRVTNLVAVAANDDDDANPPLSRVKFMALPNQVYYIAVDGRDGFAGNVVLNIRQSLNRVAPNDFIAAATRMPTSGSQVSTNIGATKEPGEPMHAGNAGGASLWWRYDASFDSVPVTITTSNSTFDTVLAVYTNTVPPRQELVLPTMEGLRLVVANDDAGNSTNRTSRVEFTPRPGTTYWVAVDGYNGAQGTVRIAFSRTFQGTRPPNDTFSQAAVLRGSSALTNVNTLFATSEFNDPPQIAAPLGGRSVWFRWAAPATGPVYVSTKWSDFDTLLGVYAGTNISGLFHIASNDDDGGLQTSAVVFNAIQGTEYRIAVAGYRNAGGDLVLALNQPNLILPRIVPIALQGSIALSVRDVVGTFMLQESSDLVKWTDVRTITADEADLEITAQEGVTQQFYRLRQLE